MFHTLNSIEKPIALPGLQPLRAFLKRLGGYCGGHRRASGDGLPFEPEFYVLDDVACAPIRRR